MKKPNSLQIDILPDGTVRVETGAFEGAIHMTAARFLTWYQQELGGECEITQHGHEHTHTHNGTTIKHSH